MVWALTMFPNGRTTFLMDLSTFDQVDRGGAYGRWVKEQILRDLSLVGAQFLAKGEKRRLKILERKMVNLIMLGSRVVESIFMLLGSSDVRQRHVRNKSSRKSRADIVHTSFFGREES